MNDTTAPPALTRKEVASIVFLLVTVILMAVNPVSGPWLLDRIGDVGAVLAGFLGGVAGMIWSVVNAVIMGVTSLF